jgi:hypothetical protein
MLTKPLILVLLLAVLAMVGCDGKVETSFDKLTVTRIDSGEFEMIYFEYVTELGNSYFKDKSMEINEYSWYQEMYRDTVACFGTQEKVCPLW